MTGLGPWKGNWALVTGASSGLGREFCVQLAALGMNLVMVARRKALLDVLAAELSSRHGVRALALEQDLAVAGSAARVQAAVAAHDVRIRLLVNNAGAGPWGRFERVPASTHEALMQLLAGTPIALSALLLPDLVSFPHSAIVNVSSPAALQPMPFLATYAAAKACLHHASLALHEEWKDRGVYVQTLVPGPTQTEFDVKAGAYPSALPAKRDAVDAVVRASLDGLSRRAPVVATAHGLYRQRVFGGLLPTALLLRKLAQMFRPPDDGEAPSRTRDPEAR